MDWERKMQVENIIYAHKLKMITFEEAEQRMKEIFILDSIKKEKSQNINYKLN